VPAIDATSADKRDPGKAPTCIRLGDLSSVFRLHCFEKGVSAQDEIRDLISRALARPHDLALQRPFKDDRLRVALGPRKPEFEQWCKSHGVTASTAVKILIGQALMEDIQDAQKRFSGTHQTEGHEAAARAPGKVVQGMQDSEHHASRLRIRLRHSELHSLGLLAEKRRLSTQRLVTQVLRAFLLKAAVFTRQESVDLGAINLSLMRIGNNLNQIARRVNVSAAIRDNPAEENPDDLIVLKSEIRRCMAEIDRHVQECAHALQISRERWRIEIRD